MRLTIHILSPPTMIFSRRAPRTRPSGPCQHINSPRAQISVLSSLTYTGASVLHSSSLLDARREGIDLPIFHCFTAHFSATFSDLFLNSRESLRSRYPISRISGMLSQLFTLPYFFCPARYTFFDLERRDPSNSCRIPARRLAYLSQRFRSGR
jgi:hypothetical protein